MGALLLVFSFVVTLSWQISTVMAATYYIGPFNGSIPQVDLSCGTGIGTAPAPHPCATLAYWNQNRRSILSPQNNDVVRIAPGTYASSSTSHCIIPTNAPSAGQSITYEGRAANDTPIGNYTAVVIDG